MRGAGGVDEVDVRLGERVDTIDRSGANRNPGRLAFLAPGLGLPSSALGRCRGEAAEDRVEDGWHARKPSPVAASEDGDAPQDRQHGRQADLGSDPFCPRSRRPEQVADPAGEHLELLLADAGTLGDRVGLGVGLDRDQAIRPVGIQAVSHRHAAQPGGHASVATTPRSSWSAPLRASTVRARTSRSAAR